MAEVIRNYVGQILKHHLIVYSNFMISKEINLFQHYNDSTVPGNQFFLYHLTFTSYYKD